MSHTPPNAVLKRTPLQAWYIGPDEVREHTDGDRVSAELLTRLSELGRGHACASSS